MLSRRLKIILGTGSLVLAALVITLQVTDVCDLEAVTLDGREINNWQSKFGLAPKASLFRQPVDSLAKALLNKKSIVKVEIDYDWPHRLEITTNQFEPVCFVIDAVSGQLYGLNQAGLLVKVKPAHDDWEHPIFTHVRTNGLYRSCADARVQVILDDLALLHDENRDLYRLINEIDFESSHFLVVTISGLSYRLKIDAAEFLKQLNMFIKFLENYETDLEGVSAVDLRFDDMIITVKK